MDVQTKIQAGWQLMTQNRLKEAASIFETILKENPDNADALQLMGQIAYAVDDLETAEKFFRRSLAVNDKQFMVWLKLGELYQRHRKPEKVNKCFEGATRADPDNAEGWRNLGYAYLSAGNMQKAENLLRKACLMTPPAPQAFRLLADAFSLAEDDDVVKRTRELLVDPTLENFAKTQLHYTLSYVYQRLDRDDEFVRYLHEANRLQKQTSPEWKLNFLNNYNILKASLNLTVFNKTVPDTAKKLTPIFIVGLPRSGSTLLEQILSSHAEVGAVDEVEIMPRQVIGALAHATGKPFLEGVGDASEDQLKALSSLYQSELAKLVPDKAFVTDKFLGNFWAIGLIRLILPWAKVIHVTRDARDTAFSIYRSCFMDYMPYSMDLRDIGEYYALYRDVMDFWGNLLPGFVYEVSFEALVNEQEAETRKLLEFCGLAWDAACLAPEKNQRQILSLSQTQARRPISAKGIGKWKRYEAEMSPFISALKEKGRL